MPSHAFFSLIHSIRCERALRIATGLPKSYSPQALIILYTTKINRARTNQRFPLHCGWNATVEKRRRGQLAIRALIALVTLCFTSLAPALAATDYSCVQACVSHGSLYQECVARCTSVTPGAPPNVPAPAGAAPTLTPPPVAPQPALSAPPVTPGPQTIESQPPAPQAPTTRTVQPPRSAPTIAPSAAPAPPTASPTPPPTQPNVAAPRKTPATATRPPPIVNGNCLARCKDRGQLYDYCLKLCSSP